MTVDDAIAFFGEEKKNATCKRIIERLLSLIHILPLYRRIIETYEGNDLRVDEEGKIFINGEQTDTYTFRMNYYWMRCV